MAGYTRQSVADILNGSEITAPPINAEFNQLVAAFNGTTGHSHDGTTGNAPKIDLTTSLSGYLPAAHGGVGGKNKFDATSAPATSNDNSEGYAPGSMWENVTDGRVYICVGNTSNAAVWRELVTVFSGPKIEPVTHNTIDLGTTSKRFKDLFLQGGATIEGNSTFAGTLGVSGLATLDSLTVTNATTLNGAVTIGNSSADLVGFNGRLTTGLVPNTDDNVDLGTSTLEWRNLYLDGTAHIDTLDVDENAGIDGNLSVTGNTTLTGTLGVTGDTTVANLSATGTTTITSGDINSGAMDNTTIGGSTPAAGTFTTLNANTSLTAATADINGGTIDGASVGATTPSTGAFTSLSASGTSTLTTVDINGGAIDGTTIGASSHTTGKFTTLQSTGQATLDSVNIDGGAIDGTTIGATTTSSGAFTTLSASGGITGDITGDVTGNVTGNVTGDITGDVTGDLTGNVTASSGSSTFNNVTINGSLDMDASSAATITNLTSPTNTNDAATKGYVDTSLANLVDSAPGTLDTLNELAAALGDDPNFSTTITNSIATKLPLAGGTMTGAIAMGTSKITGLGDPTAAQDAATKNYVDNQDALQVTKTGDSMSGNLAMGSNNITGLATPTANDHATNKSYVDGILGSATAASASAAAAATSEANAGTSETNASNSASAAAADRATVESIYDQFDDRYLGSKSAAPTLDNDGDALVYGALYFNTTTNLMYVYSSSGWVTAGSAVNGTTDRVSYTATAGQTVFSATYDAGYVDVYMNGVRLVDGSDFTATNGTSITLSAGAAVGDLIDIVGYGTFTLADHYTKTEADNRYVNVAGDTMTGALTTTGLTVDGNTFKVDGSTNRVSVGTTTTYIGNDFTVGSTDPKFILDNGAGSVLAEFSSEGTSTNNVNLKALRSGELIFSTNNSPVGRFDASGNFLVGTTTLGLYNQSSETGLTFGSNLQIARDGGVVQYLNRLTSNGEIMQFRKDGAQVGSITTHGGSDIGIGAGDTGLRFQPSADAIFGYNNISDSGRNGAIDLGKSDNRFRDLHLGRRLYTAFVNADSNTSTGTYFTGGSNNRRQLQFNSFNTGSLDAGHEIKATSTSGRILLTTYNTTHLTLDAVSNTSVFNEGGTDQDFRVESDSNANAIFMDAGASKVGINTSSTSNGILSVYSPTTSGKIFMSDSTLGYGYGAFVKGYGVTGSGGYFQLGSVDANTETVAMQVNQQATSINLLTRDGASGSSASRLYLDQIGGGGAVFNQTGQDYDFRVESDSNANAFLVDAGTSKAMFNTNYNADGGVVTIRGTYGAYNASDFRGNNALVLSGADPGSSASGSGVNLAFVPISNRGASAVISGENTSTNKEGGARLRFSTGSGAFPTSLDENLMLNHNSGAIFNDAGTSKLDFRVETDAKTHALFVDAGQNVVAVNTSSTSAARGEFTVAGTMYFEPGGIAFNTTNPRPFMKRGGDGALQISAGSDSSSHIQFYTAPSSGGTLVENMKLDKTGNFYLGDDKLFDSNWRTNDGWRFRQAGTHNYIEHVRTGTSDSSANVYMVNNLNSYRFFSFNTPTAQIGSIANNSMNSVNYNTTSDHRLKENVVDISDGITRVKQLQPRRFSWLNEEADAPTVDGFIAHEAQTVVPESVTGDHNEVDDEGNPVYQGIDQAKLVPLLTAALQEAITKIEDLEARVAALEA